MARADGDIYLCVRIGGQISTYVNIFIFVLYEKKENTDASQVYEMFDKDIT